jgi:hypothetical protein
LADLKYQSAQLKAKTILEGNRRRLLENKRVSFQSSTVEQPSESSDSESSAKALPQKISLLGEANQRTSQMQRDQLARMEKDC